MALPSDPSSNGSITREDRVAGRPGAATNGNDEGNYAAFLASIGTPDRGGTPLSTPRGFTWQAGVIAASMTLWENFPQQLAGLDPVNSYKIYGGLILLGFAYYWVQLLRQKLKFTIWEFFALLLFAWCFISSYNFSTFIAPQPLEAWALSFYTVAPLLLLFGLKAIKATRQDAEQALFWTAFLTSLLASVDYLAHTGLLASYARVSAFQSDPRLVFFKVEAAFGLVIAIVRTYYSKKTPQIIFNAAAVIIIGYNSFVLAEQRVFILATVIAAIPIWLFSMRGFRKYFAAGLAPFAAVPLALYLIQKYLPDFKNLDDYLSRDGSTQYRLLEMDYFRRAYEATDGMGFGFMSGNIKYDNVLSFGRYQAGFLVHTGDYGMAILDIGLISALYQFGYVGLILVLVLTVMSIVALSASAWIGREYAITSACGFQMAALMINPISTNFFTLFYTAHIGAILYFMASQVEFNRGGRRLPRAPGRGFAGRRR